MSSIGSIGSGNSSSMMHGMRQRPDPAKMAEDLFSKLDTSGQGFIQKSDLQTAFDSVLSTSASASSVDDLFSTLDADSDGKVSKQEFTDTLTKLQGDLEQQFQDGRMQVAMQAGDKPPPPPPGGGPSMTKDELTSTISQMDASDSRSALMSDIVQNFDAADTDGDGKVSFQEAMAFQASSDNSSTTTTASSGSNSEAKVMMQIMRLMQAYNIGDEQSQGSSLFSSLSVSA